MAIGANFGITGKGQFVYYQDDYVNHHPEVGNSILKDVSNIQTNRENNIRNAGLSLMAAGMAEATKEKELIEIVKFDRLGYLISKSDLIEKIFNK